MLNARVICKRAKRYTYSRNVQYHRSFRRLSVNKTALKRYNFRNVKDPIFEPHMATTVGTNSVLTLKT